MKTRIGLLLAAGAIALAMIAVLPAFADTPGVSPTCFAQAQNPHPTAPAGQTTDTLFCSPTNSNGSGSGSGSGGGGSGQAGVTGGSSTTAGTTNGGAPSSSTHKATTGGKQTASPSSGFFTRLGVFLDEVGGLAFLFGFLILLALVLLAIGVIGWLRRREGAGWAARFARVTHRA